ncbi:MAG: DUF6429 family protein, partial [Eubacterium sp.]
YKMFEKIEPVMFAPCGMNCMKGEFVLDKVNENREKISANEAIKELSLLLMYLTRFNNRDRLSKEENNSWKGYPFKVLDELEEEDLINQGSHRSKSVHIYEEGLVKAKELLVKYGIADRKE